MIPLGQAAKYLREELRLSQRAAAEEVGISFVYLNRIETGKACPSPNILERYRKAWGVDLYMLAVGLFTDLDELPGSLRAPMEALTNAWKQQIEATVVHRTEVSQTCSESSG